MVQMARMGSALAVRLDFGDERGVEPKGDAGCARLRLARGAGAVLGPEKYRVLDLKRRRAQIKARRVLGL